MLRSFEVIYQLGKALKMLARGFEKKKHYLLLQVNLVQS
jgi:hypothetical protein